MITKDPKFVENLAKITKASISPYQVAKDGDQLELPLYDNIDKVILGGYIHQDEWEPEYLWELTPYKDEDGYPHTRSTSHVFVCIPRNNKEQLKSNRHHDGDWNTDEFDILYKLDLSQFNLFEMGKQFPENSLEEALEVIIMQTMMDQ